MPAATNLLRRPEFQCLLGLCLAGALGGCTAEQAGGEEGVSGQVSEALADQHWFDLGVPTLSNGTTCDPVDLAVSNLDLTTPDLWVVGVEGRIWNSTLATPTSTNVWNRNASRPSGVYLTGVAAARRGSNTDVVATDTTGKVWIRTRNSNGEYPEAWAPVGISDGYAIGKPAVSTVTGSDRTDVWVRGLDSSLWHAYRIGGSKHWSDWIDEQGPAGGLTSSPSAFTRNGSPLTIDVVARGAGDDTNGYKTMARAWLNGWYPWADIGLTGLGTPSIAVSDLHELEVVGRGFGINTPVMWVNHWDSYWGWHADDMWVRHLPWLGFTGDPVCIYDNGSYNDFYVLGSGHVWRGK